MFCPKCGQQNPENGKFCRACGTDLGNVSAVMSGTVPEPIDDRGLAKIQRRARRHKDPHDAQGDALRSIITGVGFLVVSIALAMTGFWGGHSWWWAMLFPAFFALSKGIPDYIKAERLIADQKASNAAPQPLMGQPPQNYALPPNQTEYVQPESRYKTGDLVPPSVTDGTTRHLEINSEGETMTLPKK
jgi:zinc-ribbon domain